MMDFQSSVGLHCLPQSVEDPCVTRRVDQDLRTSFKHFQFAGFNLLYQVDCFAVRDRCCVDEDRLRFAVGSRHRDGKQVTSNHHVFPFQLVAHANGDHPVHFVDVSGDRGLGEQSSQRTGELMNWNRDIRSVPLPNRDNRLSPGDIPTFDLDFSRGFTPNTPVPSAPGKRIYPSENSFTRVVDPHSSSTGANPSLQSSTLLRYHVLIHFASIWSPTRIGAMASRSRCVNATNERTIEIACS